MQARSEEAADLLFPFVLPEYQVDQYMLAYWPFFFSPDGYGGGNDPVPNDSRKHHEAISNFDPRISWI